MIDEHESNGNACTVLTVDAPNPTGYGRIIRNRDGDVERIVEQKDATEEERRVREINAGVYLFRRRALTDTLPEIDNDNAQGEYYLPDVLARLIQSGEKVGAFRTDRPEEIQGINTPEQLGEANRLYRERMTAQHV
jgi:bifunctional UDP-N-acetylglucosamine pyrophosphorylase/glucosamine-1-phosphate N-acetyltransferase